MKPKSAPFAASGVTGHGPRLFILAALLFLVLTGSILAQTDPAVSQGNGQVAYAGGNMNSSEGPTNPARSP